MNFSTLIGAALFISGLCSAQSDSPQATVPLVLIGGILLAHGISRNKL